MSGPTRTCGHLRARHEHGTNAAYHLDRCRCRPCSQAAVAYDRQRARQIAYGRWQPYIDAAPARAHVASLRAAGLGLKRIAALSGVPHGVLWKLVYGKTKPDGTRTPSVRVRPSTAAALLSVHVGLDVIADTICVDGIGTRRRIQALVSLGWSQSKLSAILGLERSNFPQIVTRDQVHASTARAVRDLYERLSDQQPPEDNHRDRIAASRARNIATARGWLGPGWWDDDTIDDPSHQPPTVVRPASDIDLIAVERACAGDDVTLTRAERIAAVVQLSDTGLSQLKIARLLRMHARQVIRDMATATEGEAVAG